MATGIYKPRVKCYDVNNLSLKFERCLDSEVVTFEILSEDYTKVNKNNLIFTILYVMLSAFVYTLLLNNFISVSACVLTM